MHIEYKYDKLLDLVVLKFYNEITIFQEREFRETLNTYKMYNDIILDFSELGYIDSTGINAIVTYSKKRDVYILTRSSNMLSPILKILNLDRILKVYESLEELYNDIGKKHHS